VSHDFSFEDGAETPWVVKRLQVVGWWGFVKSKILKRQH
jgi:hypothetical protein